MRQVKAIQRNVPAGYGKRYQLKRENNLLSDAKEYLESELNTLLVLADALIGGLPFPISSGGNGPTPNSPWDGHRPNEKKETYNRKCMNVTMTVAMGNKQGYRKSL